MLTIEAKERVIGGTTYRVKPLATRPALVVMTRVLKLAGPGFADVASLREAAALTKAALGRFVVSALEGVSDDMIPELCMQFAEVSEIALAAGSVPLKATWEEHFRGDLASLFEWLSFAAEVTYGPLLASLGVQRSAAPGARAAE